MDIRAAQQKFVSNERLSTGIGALDSLLGGGLLPGSMTMLVGATGVGKTQLGLHFLQAGLSQENRWGAIIDLSSRGDSQNHCDYSSRLFDRVLTTTGREEQPYRSPFSQEQPSDILSFLGYSGRRVLRSQMDSDAWHAWQSDLNARMPHLFRFVYAHLVHGTRRFVVDGIEPQEQSNDSLQLDLLEIVYHRMLRQEHDWLAREVLREQFRAQQDLVDQHAYDHRESALVVLVTTKHTLLEELMTLPLGDGDLAAGANTVILLGRQLREGSMGRALYVAKHRGSFADSRIVPFDISDKGIELEVDS